MERPRAQLKTKKAAGGSGGFLVRPHVGATRYTSGTTRWSIRQNRTASTLRTASPSVSTLLLNYFKCRRRSTALRCSLEFRQSGVDEATHFGVELLDDALDGRRHLDAGRNDFREVQAALFARHREIVRRRRLLLRAA